MVSAPVGAPSGAPRLAGELMVFAAASLTDAFADLGVAFEAANPEAIVTFNFAASSELVTQIAEGAPADVFASADLKSMSKLIEIGRTASEPVVFATNRAQIIVEPGNPRAITGLADLSDDELIVISCAPAVPCGRYTQEILERAGVVVSFRSLEENVKAVVSKVVLGEADAAIVYATDVLAAGTGADGVEIPADLNVTAEYPVAVTKESVNPDLAQAFVDFVVSAEGRAVLESYGFATP